MRKLKLWTAVAAVVMLCALALPAAAFAEDGPTFASGEKFDLYTSSTIKDATDSNGMAKHMLDGVLSTVWRSAWVVETAPPCDEYVLFDFREIVKIESVTLTARPDGMMFPDGFGFYWSTSNEVEIPIEGQIYDGYQSVEGNVNVFVFDQPVVARYLKMNIWSRTPDEGGIHLVNIAEADAAVTEATAEEQEAAVAADAAAERPLVVNDPVLPYSLTTSSFLDDADKWLPEHLTDNNITTQWCSEWVATTNEEDEIYVTMSLGDPQRVTGVILSTQGVCFPRDFVFQYTLDNENWVDIPGTAQTDFELDGSQSYVFPFGDSQVASAVRLKVTKKTADGGGNYLVQLADVDVRGFAATEEEIEEATAAFNEAIGNLPEDPDVKPTPIPATPEDFESEGCGAAAGSGSVLGLAVLSAAALLKKKKEARNA